MVIHHMLCPKTIHWSINLLAHNGKTHNRKCMADYNLTVAYWHNTKANYISLKHVSLGQTDTAYFEITKQTRTT